MTRREWVAATLVPVCRPGMPWAQQTSGMTSSLTELSLVALVDRLRRHVTSPVEVIEAYLARIGRQDAELHAYITVTADLARARARQLAAGGRGALLGVPVAHKDLFETAGVLTTAGSKLYEGHVPTSDATLVARLSAAGAITLGKTNTHELGGGVTTINPYFGSTRNPRDPDRIAGGSSGGSAAAVAAHMAVAATGSDTGGSIRIPAAFCGCVGFKPTFGLLSTAGVLAAAPTLDHTGFLTRSVPDVVPLLRATMGVDVADPNTTPAVAVGEVGGGSLHNVRIGVPRAYFFEDLGAEVARALEASLAQLRNSGATVVDVRVPVDGSTMARVFDPIVVAEIHHTYERDWHERPALFSPAFAGFFRAPLPTGLELATAYRERRRFQAAIASVFDHVDILATATVPIVAPALAGPIDGSLILRNTWPWNAAHAPALTLPCGPGDRLPVGLQLVARPYEDARLLQIAALIEASLA